MTLVVDEESLRKPKTSPVSEEESLRKLKTRTDWLTTPQNVQDIVTNREKLSARERFFMNNTTSPPQARRGQPPDTHGPPATNGTNLNDATTRIPVSRARPARTPADANNRNVRHSSKIPQQPPKSVLKKPQREINGDEIDNRPSSVTRHVGEDTKGTRGSRHTDSCNNQHVIPYDTSETPLSNGNCESSPLPSAQPAQPPTPFQDATQPTSPLRNTIQPPLPFQDATKLPQPSQDQPHRPTPTKKPAKPLRATHTTSKLPKPHQAVTPKKTTPHESSPPPATQPTRPLHKAALPSPPSHDAEQPSQPLSLDTQPPPEPFRDAAQPPEPCQATTEAELPSPTLQDITQPPPTPFKDTTHPSTQYQSPTQPPQPFRDTTPTNSSPLQATTPTQDTHEKATKPTTDNAAKLPKDDQPVDKGVTNGWGEEQGERGKDKADLEKEKEKEEMREEEQEEPQKPSSRDSASSLEDKIRPGSEEHSVDGMTESQEETEKARKASKVSRFVRMFNRREAHQTEVGTDRASGRKSQNRVWAMCLQAQSPNKDDDDDLESSSEVIKSDSHLDQCPDGTHKGNPPPWADTSSLGDVDTRQCQDGDVEDKRRSLNIEVENRSLIRSCGGRRSFDKPQSRARLTTKRSNTLEDMDDSRHAASRSSKTLPAKPTAPGKETTTSSSSSSPFYRRFYSHCMILPAKRRKRGAKNKNRDNLEDSSSQGREEQSAASRESTAGEENGGGGEAVAKGGENKVDEGKATAESSPDDSPKRFPVIDGFLAEIMESVTLMEKEMTEDEAENDDEEGSDEGAAAKTDEEGDTHDGEGRKSSLELLSDGTSRVSSLISRFEQCTS